VLPIPPLHPVLKKQNEKNPQPAITDLITTMEALVVARAGLDYKLAAAASRALMEAAESEVEVEPTLAEAEVELTVLTVKTSTICFSNEG
jgi:hypothetical protein